VDDRVLSVCALVELASFQIFGGLVFLVIGLEFVFKGPVAIQMLVRGSSNLAVEMIRLDIDAWLDKM